VLLLLGAAALCAHAQEAKPAPIPEASQVQGPQNQAPGELPIVTAIRVEGRQRYSEAQLTSALSQQIGKRLDMEFINRGLDTLWTSFHVRGDVRLQDVAPTPEAPAGGVELVLIVVEMPSDREPRFIGNVDIDTKTLKRWGLIEERVEMFVYQTNRVRQRLLEGYHREGYYWVEIDVVKRGDDTAPGALLADVIFEIREGPKVRVKGVHVSGNRSMPNGGFLFWRDGLNKFASPQLSGPSLFSWFGSPFVQETLDADLIAMRQVYRERGWMDARVEVEKLSWNDDRSEVHVHIIIDEGEPYVVEELKIEFYEFVRAEGVQELVLRRIEPGLGLTLFSAEELLAKCDLKPGKRYEEILRNRDRATLREIYGEKGHLSHPSLPQEMRWEFPDPEVFYRPGEHLLQVTYRIVEGRPLTLREISFGGTHHTRDKVLRSDVSVFPGDKADQKEINKSLARIVGSGFFSDQFAPLDHEEPSYRFVAVEGSRDLVDLEYMVQEGRVVEFNISGGIDSNDGAFGLISLSMKNFDISDTPSKWTRTFSELFRKEAFHGAGQRVDIELSPGTKVSRSRLHFLEPDIFNRYIEPISFDVEYRRQLRGYQAYDEQRTDVAVKFGRKFGFDTSVSMGLVQSSVNVSDLNPSGVPVALEQQNAAGVLDLTGITFDAYTRSLDSIVNPHNGWKASLRNTLYADILPNDAEYWRMDLQTDGYMATGTLSNGTEHFLHLEIDGGIMPTFGNTSQVPYTERFQIGGSNSIRGFEYRGAGARGVDVLGAPTKYAAGGESYMGTSLEWIYPLFSTTQPGSYRQIETLRGVLFTDWAVLGQEAFDIDLSETRASVGFGVGLAYPLPIQLNFGFPVRRFSGDERQTFSFSIGISF
jgi:outer membrane protein insertion porin family